MYRTVTALVAPATAPVPMTMSFVSSAFGGFVRGRATVGCTPTFLLTDPAMTLWPPGGGGGGRVGVGVLDAGEVGDDKPPPPQPTVRVTTSPAVSSPTT